MRDVRENFADRLMAAIDAKGTSAIVGIDPQFDLIPETLKGVMEGRDDCASRAAVLYEFGKRIVDIVARHVPCVKIQSAYFEAYGPAGVKAYADLISYARKCGLLTIGDIKRGDIKETAEAYANGHLGRQSDGSEPFGVDAVTVNPYLGSDGVRPFIETCRNNGKGIFVLVKTSNPSSVEIQDLEVVKGWMSDGSQRYERHESPMPLYKVVAILVEKWGKELVGKRGYSAVGAVVGATFPEQARALRALMPRSYFLVPGYGAQGATADDVRVCFNSDGYGAIVNSSRGIIFAHRRSPWKEQYGQRQWEKAVEAATLQFKAEFVR